MVGEEAVGLGGFGGGSALTREVAGPGVVEGREWRPGGLSRGGHAAYAF